MGRFRSGLDGARAATGWCPVRPDRRLGRRDPSLGDTASFGVLYRSASWLPPGQYDIGDTWPVLIAEATPNVSTATSTFTVGST
jgi:hypothetical protein